MRFYRYAPMQDTLSKTDQDCKTLTEILEEYLTSGVMEGVTDQNSYDFDNLEDVDLRAPLATDVDLYDAASGQATPFDGIPQPADPTPPAPAEPTPPAPAEPTA